MFFRRKSKKIKIQPEFSFDDVKTNKVDKECKPLERHTYIANTGYAPSERYSDCIRPGEEADAASG